MKLKTVLSFVVGWSLTAFFVWLVMLAAAGLLLIFVPSSMKLVERNVCAEGATLELRKVTYGRKTSIHMDCVDSDGARHSGQELRAVARVATLLFVPVFLLLFAGALLRKAPPSAPDAPMPPLEGSVEEEVRHLMEQGQRIQAIKRVRAATGVSLKQAMQYVETGGGASGRLARALAQAPAAAPTPVETLRQLKELLDAGLITPEDYEGKKAEVLSRM